MIDKNNIENQDGNNFENFLEKLGHNQKEIFAKIESKSDIFENEKRKNKIKLLSILYSTYLFTVPFFKKDRITNDDLNLVKSLYDEKINDNNFISDIKALENFNRNFKKNENNQIINNNNEISKENIFILNKKKESVKSLKNIPKEEKKLSTCIFCIEEYDQNEIVNPELECKNHVHGKCFVNYIKEELNSNNFPIRCPICQNEKRHEINYKIILDCLLLNDEDNLALKLEKISLNHLAENNSEEITYCPTPGCNYMCFYNKNEYHLNCPLCKKSYCLKCKTEWHTNKTCQEYQSEKSKTENDIKFEEYVKGNNFKQCPNCKRWVEKTIGCNHIKCRCGTHFCYNCGKLMDDKHFCKGYLFGATSLFGTNNNNISLFGTNNNNISLFGTNNNNISLFGTNNNNTSLFGQNNNNTSLFGTNKNNISLFGTNNNNNTSLFGTNNNNISLFGTNNNNFSLFGTNNNNTNLFGTNNNNISLFGTNNNNTNLFGTNKNNKSLFGQNNNNTSNINTSLFGTNNNNTSLFGTNNNITFGINNNSPFEANNNASNSLFRENNNSSLFGTNNNNISSKNIR